MAIKFIYVLYSQSENFVKCYYMEKFHITSEGFDKLEKELKNLKSVERPAVIAAIAEARAHGDLSENAEYSAAREKQSFIEGRIKELEDKLSRAEVIDTSEMSGVTHVKFGAKVTIVDVDNDKKTIYQIVSEYEADIENKKISIQSPMARALIGKTVGDFIEVMAPKGAIGYEIVTVHYE